MVSKAKTAKSFRDLLIGFFQMLVSVLHESELLYKEKDLMDNIHAWLASMSSSSLRPFRHTATTISLAITSGLVQVAHTLDSRITSIEQQLQASKRTTAKAKSFEIGLNLNEATEYRKACTEMIQSFFDTVFVHRYRDFDPKIRTECVEALGNWIWDLPTAFMEPSYLRYLGWMLSDTNAATRQEVLRQLGRVFKRSAEQLGHFIDRFRPRLVEMATRDVEVSVRVAAISVMNTLRSRALLEPSEIDAIGELIFDTEPRIRKAVVDFFVASVEDVFEAKVEELGGGDILDEFDSVEEDDFSSPRREWVNVKCLAETLANYDAQIEERQPSASTQGLDLAVDLLATPSPETRISLASQVLYDKVDEVKQWQVLAGYLLFDHTTSSKSRSKSKPKSSEAAFKKAVAPSSSEEAILLKVLTSAVKANIAHTAELDKGKRRGQRMEAPEAQEEIAIELASIIPQLLNKFGAEPETVTTVLQLEHFLNLGIFQQLRQDVDKYGALLDEICTQFNRHDDVRVISEAAAALLHARQHDELEELADGKLSSLWENNREGLRHFDSACELSVRGNLSEDSLRSLSTTLMKMSKLAGISDCVDVLSVEGSSAESSSPTIDILAKIVHRGKYEPQEDIIDDLEDEVVSYAIKACQFYFMWRVRSLAKLLADGVSLSDSEADRLSVLRQTYRRYLIETLSSRAAIDELRLFATGSLCDLHLTFATLRTPIESFHPSSATTQASAADKLKDLIHPIEPGLVPELISIFDGAEKQYAKKTKRDRTLNGPAEDEDPVDDEDEDDEDEDEDLSQQERLAAELKAEKALCELTAKLVLAITGKVLDNRGPHAGKLRRRLLRNQAKLGNNFKEVLNYLDEDKLLRRLGKKPSGKPTAAAHPQQQQQQQQKSAEMVDDDIEDEVSDHGDGEPAEPMEDDDDDVDKDEEEEQDGRQDNDIDDDVLGD